MEMKLSTLLLIPVAIITLSACDDKPTVGEKVDDALDRRPGEKLRDTGEDLQDVGKDAKDAVKEAVTK